MTTPRSHDRSASALGIGVVVATATTISFSNILAPVVYGLGSNPGTLLVLRFAGFLAVCGAWLWVQDIPAKINRREGLHCIGAGVAYTLGSASLVTAFAYIPVSLAVLILYTFPLITRLTEGVLDRRLPTVREVAALAAALAGLALCLGVGLDRLNGTGLAFAFMAAIAIAGSFVWTGRKLQSVQPAVMTAHMAAVGLILAFGFTAATGTWAFTPPRPMATALMAAAVFSFAGAFLGMFLGVRLIGASRTAMLMNLEPVLTLGLAIVLLDEHLSGHQLLGAAVVIAAVVAIGQATLRMRPTHGTPSTPT